MAAQRILVIEDEPGAREALESLLTEEGYVVRTAPDGLAGLECVRDFRPDTVVCDVRLPDINGLQVLRRTRTLADDEVVFIVVTAGGTSKDVEEALRREADVFIEKPIDLNRFRRILRQVLPPPGNGVSPILH
jgi:two-component system, NtrC family, response regulator AtoC